MKIFNSILAVLVLCLGSISAQTFIGKVNPNPPDSPQIPSNYTYNILAVMVEFEEDNDGATFGTGKFGSIYSGENATRKDIIDPLPHNKTYFENHLLFAKNYFSRVSDGKSNINYTVFDQVITVSQTMRNYSPLPKSDDLENVVGFAEEVWQIAEANYSGSINFGDYDIYAIFHAGVGRDVSLPGSIGNERDLPSVYLSKNTFRQYLGDTFEGFTGNGVQNVIDNTMIIPCTESREIDAVSGIYLLELSINGLIAASIGSHMGLPDLFNTETGLSAIGRFGLMDGQSIFTYGGLFPPEPSPWEKMYLGWITPLTVQNGINFVSLAAKMAASPSDTLYLKVPINESEYYLVENRARDANNDNVTITVQTENGIETMSFEKDTTGFQSFEIDSAKGVVIDVDEYDWAVPGSGIVIWHIDEGIINEKLASNTINNDTEFKGVDVEEADGIQDIGERFYTVFGDEVIGEGSEDDLWYSSNEAELYENRFSFDTKPNTNSNDGANSLISFDNFSDISNKMSFSVSNGINGISLNAISSIPVFDENQSAAQLNYSHPAYGSGYLTFNNAALTEYDINGNQKYSQSDFSLYKPALITAQNRFGAIGVVDDRINLYINGGVLGTITGLNPTCAPVAVDGATTLLYVGAADGSVTTFSIDFEVTNTINTVSSLNLFDTPINQIVVRYENGVSSIGAVSGSKFKFGAYPEFDAGESIIQAAASVSPNSNDLSILMTATRIIILENGRFFSEVELGAFSGASGFALGELNDNTPESVAITVAKGESIAAWNHTGAMLDNFPVRVTGEDFGFIPSTTFNMNVPEPYLYVLTTDGKLFSFNSVTGKLRTGFPLTVGAEVMGSPFVFGEGTSTTYINIVSKTGNLFSFSENYPSADELAWNGSAGNNANTAFLEAKTAASESVFFDETRAYNWPNPVYDDVTYIRYHVGDDSNVEIKIFDIAGDYVAELTDEATGGFDNETAWNVSDIQSGVYFAHLSINGKNGGSATKIIKIAVIK